MDDNLSWSYHIKDITSKVAKTTKKNIDERCWNTFYDDYIHSKLKYGILLFGGAATHQLRTLKSLQKSAVKFIVNLVLMTSSKQHVFSLFSP